MSDDNKNEFKKNISNSFVWLLLALFFVVLFVQNFMETKQAKVSFSYQLENLVNLDLIEQNESRKIALNDNLVTFSGRFRDQVTDEGKKRYKFLELLNTNQDLLQQKEILQEQMLDSRTKVKGAAEQFLQLSGTPIPRGGYLIVDEVSPGFEQEGMVEITSLPSFSGETIGDLTARMDSLSTRSSSEETSDFGRSLTLFIRNLRAPSIGIGNEQMKQTLRTLDRRVKEAQGSSLLSTYRSTLNELQEMIAELNTTTDGVRLTQLRSVRNYLASTEEWNDVYSHLETNTVQLNKARQAVSGDIWFFNNKEVSTRSLEKQDPEQFHQWFLIAKEEWSQFPANQGGAFKAPDQPLNLVLEKTFKSEEPPPNYWSYLFTLMPIFLVILVLYFLFARQMKGMGSGAMNFGKSPAKLLEKGKNKVTFKDVAGVDEALEELKEIVDYLKAPHKFTALGGQIPKGVLCVGPPGTGKTLIAKAVAGEADRPFFSISGSDFVEMFVGVGASRIRDMFEQAKKSAPCIIFMDEIDAVGRHRGAGVGGGHDEREQTLNQLLVEMDGFDTNEGVILMAATNRPDVLDKALLRPGRFDRRVIINLPDIKGRFEILKVHARNIKLDPAVDLMRIARGTPGSSGADLKNILNESALIAAKKNKNAITETDTVEARDKVLYGKERRSLEVDENEQRTTAYHESGHAIVALVVKDYDHIDKVTIIPRGFSLGATQFLPKKDRVSYWEKELYDRLAVLMGGRSAEEIFVGDVSSGARQDFEQATSIARSMVCEWGMSEKLGVVAYDEHSESGQYLGVSSGQSRNYSEETAKSIDEEVRRILNEAHEKAKEIILEHRDQVELMTEMLIEFETLDNKDLQKILNNEWDTEEKKKDLLEMEKKHQKEAEKSKKTPPPVPPDAVRRDEPPAPTSLRPDIPV